MTWLRSLTIRWHLAGLALFVSIGACPSPNHAAPASNWVLDPGRTQITFSIDAIGYPRTEGEFHTFTGRVMVDFDHPERSRVDFHVETQSVEVGSASFSDYVRGEALLDATRFNEIVFSSTGVKKLDERDVVVTGDLTMLGVTRPLTVGVTVARKAGQSAARLGFIARAKIDRLDYGMNTGFPVISRYVELTVASEAIEQ